MAITQRQSPTTPNMVESDLIYAVSSNNGSRPQFQFVAKIRDKDNNEVVIKQQPVPTGTLPAAKGVFNISQIARDYMGNDTPWKTQKVSQNESCNEFDVIFFEETGSSVSSSVSIVNGTSGSSVYLIDGVVEMNSGDWNWASGSYYIKERASVANSFSHQNALTTSPISQSIREDEYATISIINGNFDGDNGNAQDIHTIQVSFFDEGRTPQTVFSWPNTTGNGGGPRSGSVQPWQDAYDEQTAATRMIHVAAGPQNLIDRGLSIPADWASYKVEAFSQDDAGLDNSDGVWFERWFTRQEPECDYEGTRFAWLNELGGWDYFTFPFAVGKSDSIERKTFKQSFIDYSDASSYTVGYDKARRGSKIFSINYDETRTAESDYLTQEQADWLRTLVESPDVYIQEGTDFLPIVIQTADYEYKTNPRTQKLYRLSLTYKLANNRRSR